MTRIAEGVYWVGAVDWNMRNFHGYATQRGTTYNAYLVLDEKKALIDTVKESHLSELLAHIREVLDPAEIDYIVSLHVEKDHSGSLPQVKALCPKAKVVTVERHGEQGLERYFPGLPLLPVKEGSQLSLGKTALSFIPTPLVHWPDNMMAYLSPGGVLFSSDNFGQHLATSPRFDDEVDPGVLMAEAAKYYANIFMPYPRQAGQALERSKALLPQVIAPAHGVCWRQKTTEVFDAYSCWVRGDTQKRALVIYDTMWGATELMAQAITQGVASEGVEARLVRLGVSDLSDVMAQILEAKALAVGSPLLNNNLLPSVAAFLTYLKGFRPRGRLGAAFGAYGWGGATAAKTIAEDLKLAGLEVLEDQVAVRFAPTPEELEACRALGRKLAQKIRG